MKKKARELSGLKAWLPKKTKKKFFGTKRDWAKSKRFIKKEPIPFFLRLKCALYRYTGIYLLNEELLDYLQSEQYWKAFKKLSKKQRGEFSQSLLIGLWETEQKLYRPMRIWHYKFRKYGRIPFFIAEILSNIHTGFVAAKWDFLDFFK